MERRRAERLRLLQEAVIKEGSIRFLVESKYPGRRKWMPIIHRGGVAATVLEVS